METSEVLNKAADVIEERGWAKGNCGMSVTGPTCVEGAIGAAIGVQVVESDCELGDIYSYSAVETSPAHAALLNYLGGKGCYFGWQWNDQQESAEPVIAALRAAALIEAAKENADTRAQVTA